MGADNFGHQRRAIFAACVLFLAMGFFLSSGVYAQKTEMVASGFVFPEGPAFDSKGNLYVVDCQTKLITKVTPEGEASYFVATPGKNNGSIVDKNDILYLAGWDTGTILKVFPNGVYTLYLESYKDEPLQGPNDFAFDLSGRLYFTDPLYGKNPDKCSRVMFVDAAGEVQWLADIPGYTNGIAFGKDASILYVAETNQKQIWKIIVAPDGSAREKSVLITLPDPGGPDGMAVDINGNLYIAAYGSGFIRVVSPQGELIDNIAVPGKNPTNCKFGGPTNDCLYVTDTDTKAVYKIPVGVKGLPLIRY